MPRLLGCMALLLAACLHSGASGGAQPDPVGQRPAVTRRLALLVGISDYDQTGPRPWHKLNTHRDIAQLKEVLLRKYGFREADIRTLEDGAATASGIRQAVRSHLIDQAEPGSIVLFHFSGHGQQVPDDNGDELDGLDESLVPQDVPSEQVEIAAKLNIRDDELATWLAALEGKMRVAGKVQGSINVFLDSCYSGTATRGLLTERGRGWDVSLDGPRPQPVTKTAQPQEGASGLLPQGDAERHGYIFLAASQSDQTAKEVGGMGAFTRALVTALSQADPRTTYRTLHDQILVEVAGRVRDQNPEIEGPQDELLFSGVARPAEPYLLVQPLDADTVQLPIGELHGAAVDSLFQLHRRGSARLDAATVLAEARIESVDAFVSTARLTPPYRGKLTPEALAAARAVEKTHAYRDEPLLLQLEALETLPALASQLRQLDIVTTRGADAQHYQVQLRLNSASQQLELRRPESAAPFATVQPDDRAAERIEDLLRAEWRWQYLLRLKRANPYVQATLRFVPVSAAEGGGAPRPREDVSPASHIRLQEGDLCMLELRNDTVNDIYVTVLELGVDGTIAPIFPGPDGGDNLIPGGQTVRLGASYLFRLERPFGRLIYKVIATADKVDLSSLVHRAAQQARSWTGTGQLLVGVPQQLSPLARLLAAAALGRRELATAQVDPPRWGVTDASIDLQPGSRPRP